MFLRGRLCKLDAADTQRGRSVFSGFGGFARDEGADLLLVRFVWIRRAVRLWLYVLFEGGEDDVFGEEFGQDVGGGVFHRWVYDVGGDAAAVDRG